jgi:sporulation protein YqfC
MRRRGPALEIAERFELPPEALSGVPKLTLTGSRRVLVENHRGLLEYSRERIEINGGRVRLRLLGEGLELRAMNGSDILVTGDIYSVELE